MDINAANRTRDGPDDDRSGNHEQLDQETSRLVNPFLLPSDEEIFNVARDPVASRSRKSTLANSIRRSSTRDSKQSAGSVLPKETAKATSACFESGRRPRETLNDFIAKKRDLFLVQMSLDTQREEIQRLEEKAHAKEEALQKSEAMLEEDQIRFDAFLKENDRKAHQAMKRHDTERRAREGKQKDLKRIRSQIQRVKSEMSDYSSQLHDCQQYKHFLDSLTPQSVLEAQEASTDAESKTTPEMYFKTPQQLLAAFTAMEERNLFLIQNSQENEEAADDLKKKFEVIKADLQTKTDGLEANISSIKAKIELERTKSGHLRERIAAHSSANEERDLLKQIGAKISQVYESCGFNAESNPDSLAKLAQIEMRLEKLIVSARALPQDYLEDAEKKKEIERRNRVRHDRLEAKRKQSEERLIKTMERSVAEVRRQVGKPVMFRSQPQRKKKSGTGGQTNKRLAEEERIRLKFFTV